MCRWLVSYLPEISFLPLDYGFVIPGQKSGHRNVSLKLLWLLNILNNPHSSGLHCNSDSPDNLKDLRGSSLAILCRTYVSNGLRSGYLWALFHQIPVPPPQFSPRRCEMMVIILTGMRKEILSKQNAYFTVRWQTATFILHTTRNFHRHCLPFSTSLL